MLALWRNLTNQDIASAHFRANLYDTVLIEVAQTVFRHIRDIASNNLWTELSFANFNRVILDIDRGQRIVFDQAAANDDSVLHIVAAPRHEGYQQIFAERQFAVSD